MCVYIDVGKKHDFRIFQESKVHFSKNTIVFADKGYQGICKIHNNSLIPFKSSSKHSLTEEQRKYNRLISQCRISIEHINRYIKRFRILSSRYRNKRKNFGIKINLICAIYNFQHS